jgi:thiol-disulfide isomerase/thioredoxin
MVKGEMNSYGWDTSAEGIANFVERNTNPRCQVLDDLAAVEKYVKDNARSVVAFYQGKAYETYDAFEQFFSPEALKSLHIPCGITKADAGKYKKDSDSVTVFANGKQISRTVEEITDSVSSFIASYAKKPVFQWSENVWEEFLVDDYKHVFLVGDTSASSFAGVLKDFTAVAQEFVGNDDKAKANVVFEVIPSQDNADLAWNEYNLLPTAAPTLRFLESSGKQSDLRQQTEGEAVSEASVKAFVAACLDGTAKKMAAKTKSERPREGWKPDEGSAIKVVAALDFNEYVNQEGKDVVLEFYAPWCAHCQRVKAEYEKLAESMSAIESITFGKMDGTKNDLNSLSDGITIKAYPTFLLFPAYSKNKVLRLGTQSNLASLTEFVQTGAMVKFELDGTKFGTGIPKEVELAQSISADELDEL